jgi:putative inorganic carbon (hco3(-)) transporter
MTGAQAGAILAAGGLAPLLGSSDRRLRTAGFAAWGAGVLVMAADLLHQPIATIRVDASSRPAVAAVGLAVGVVVLAAAAVIARRWPTLVLLVVVAAAPARIPLHAGGEQANLLVPLYAVIAVLAVVSAFELLVGDERPPKLGAIGWAAAALIGWSAVSLTWSADQRQGAVQLLFFYLPFGFLLARVAAIRPSLRDLRLALGVQVLLGLVFAAIAFWQFATRDVFWNPKIIVGNEYAAFFRVNSLFYDASIYGRFMAVTIVLVAGVAVARRVSPLAIAVIAVLLAGQYIAYSQSSLLALAAGAVVLGASIWPRRVVIGLAAICLVVGLAGLAVAVHGNSAKSVTSDRSTLLSDGWRVIRHHPLDGAGIGGFSRSALADTAHPGRVASAASHTTPVTIIAELGPLGLLAYLALLASIAWTALRGTGGERWQRLVMLAAMAALLTSSLFYNAYFEDPATWILTALIAALALSPRTTALEATA